MHKTNKKCSVSVIIPAYNVETCLERAVLSALEQVPPPLEVIVINDGSTDKTAEVARGFGDNICYLEQPNQGPAAARNSGLAAVTGEYVAFLDADDYWLPGFIKATVEFMAIHADAVAVSTGWQIQPVKGAVKTFSPNDGQQDISHQALILENFFDFWGRHDHVRTGTVLMRRSKLGINGFQRTDLRISEDLEFWAYLATLGFWGFIPEAYWFGDSARIAVKDGWLKKYSIRRTLCPTVDAWQQRITPKLKDSERPGFKKLRGRVAASYAQNMVLGGRFHDARKIVTEYGMEMPVSWITRLMKLGHRFGGIGWRLACILLLLREYQKSMLMSVTLKIPGVKK